MKSIYHRLLGLFKRKRGFSRADIEKRLSPAALSAIQKEVAFLKNTHQVSVQELEKGEKPEKPRAVDDAVEARLTSQTPAL